MAGEQRLDEARVAFLATEDDAVYEGEVTALAREALLARAAKEAGR